MSIIPLISDSYSRKTRLRINAFYRFGSPLLATMQDMELSFTTDHNTCIRYGSRKSCPFQILFDVIFSGLFKENKQLNIVLNGNLLKIGIFIPISPYLVFSYEKWAPKFEFCFHLLVRFIFRDYDTFFIFLGARFRYYQHRPTHLATVPPLRDREVRLGTTFRLCHLCFWYCWDDCSLCI